MSLEYIRNYYGVPAVRGGRVEYESLSGKQLGTIVGADGAYLRIRIDGVKHAMNYHPTWKLVYLPPEVNRGIQNAE